VDKVINKEKKRRMPLFWLFFASGLLLAGGTYYFIPDNHTTGLTAKVPEQEKGAKKQNNDQTIKALETQKNVQQKTYGHIVKEVTGTVREKIHFSSTGSKNQKLFDHTGHRTHAKKGTHKADEETNESNESGNGVLAAGTADIVISNYSNKSEKTETEKVNKKIFDSTAGKMIAGEKENKLKKDSLTSSATAKNKEEKQKGSSWTWGFTGGAGSSNLNQNLFNSVKTLSPVNFSANLPAIPNGYTNYSSSEINPGFSFQAGAFVSKNLSRRISFSAGLNYHYYSTTMKTGMKINTTLVTTNSFNQTIVANSYYENTQTRTFTNQYHLIEIPLSVNLQLNKSKRMPFIWELGVTPAYILSSNALYYDPNTNEYFSNYLKPNRIQVNGVTALMFGFPMNKSEWQIGPQIQYGFTGFVNTNDGNQGHLIYAGLKISFIPGKK
jgi:hypothetical protein